MTEKSGSNDSSKTKSKRILETFVSHLNMKLMDMYMYPVLNMTWSYILYMHMGHMASYYVIDITQTDLNDMKHVCTWHHALIDLTWDDMKWHDIMWHILGMAWYLACMWLVRFVIQITYLTHLTLTCNFLTYILVVTWCNICLSWNEMTCT